MYHQKDCLWWFCDLGSELSYILSKTQKFFLFCINYMLWLYDQKLVKIFKQLNHRQLDTLLKIWQIERSYTIQTIICCWGIAKWSWEVLWISYFSQSTEPWMLTLLKLRSTAGHDFEISNWLVVAILKEPIQSKNSLSIRNY